MKLAFVVPGFSADERDWCIPANTDLVRLLAASHEVHVFALRYPHRVDTYRIGNATVHSFNGVGSRGTTSARLWQAALSAISREQQRGKFDVIQSIFGGEAGAVAMLAARWLHVPGSIWLVDGELIGLPEISYGADLIPRQRLMNSMTLRFSDRILCGCEAMTELACSRLPRAQRSRAVTLPWGLNTQRFNYAPLRNG